MRYRKGIVTLALMLFARAVSAQDCELVNPAGANYTISNGGTVSETAIIHNGELRCPGGKYIAAREMTVIKAQGLYTLNVDVHYRDGEKSLTADFGVFYKRTGVFQGRGNVVVTDLKSGSRLSAPQLDYYQISETNKVSRVITMGGRAHATMKPKPGAAAPTGTAPGATTTATPAATATAKNDSSVVDADVIEIVGERTFRGTGSAIITRSDMKGYGNYVEYDQDRGDLLLAQSARIDNDKYKLQGDTIRAIAAEGQQIREIRASRDALLISGEVRVESPFLRIFLDSGTVNRLVATRPFAKQGQPVSIPRVLSKQFNVSADSIDALAPNQLLQRVDAIGHAYGERIDTLPPPPVAKELPNILTNDWLRGDTLHAVFVENPDKPAPGKPGAKPDTTGSDRVLKQIIALGKSASSAIRMQQPKDHTWKIQYTLADRITVDFAKGVVSKVNLEGDVHGVYLTPQGVAAPAPKPKSGGQ